MKTKFAKFLSSARYFAECTKCGFHFRRYCSKSDDKSSKTLAGEDKSSKKSDGNDDKTSTVYTLDAEVELQKVEYPDEDVPEVRNKSEELKSFVRLVSADMRNAFSYIIKENPESAKYRREALPYDGEFLILGAGALGSSIAFWLSRCMARSFNFYVVDNDLSFKQPSDTTEAFSFSLQSSLSSLRQEFELKENVELSVFGSEFIRTMDQFSSQELNFPETPFQPFGYLTLSDGKSSEKFKKIHTDCMLWRAQNELLTPYQLEQRYPWLNLDGTDLALHGLKNEGWFDPDLYIMKMRSFAVESGVRFLEGDVVEFKFEKNDGRRLPGYSEGSYRPIHTAIIKTKEGETRKINFGMCIVALGTECETLAKEKLFLDRKFSGMHHFEVPIVKRKRYLYCVACPDGGPGISSPAIIDPSGLFVKRYGPLNEYICGCPPLMNDEAMQNMDEREYFDNVVWPLLAHRIPVFQNLHLISSLAYYEDYNTFDNVPIVGFHPAYHNFYFVTGFGDRCYQHSPGIGKSVSEYFMHGKYLTVDLTRFNFNRIVQEAPLFDSCLL